MNRMANIFSLLILILAAAGCSNEPADKQSKKAAMLHRIQGKAQVAQEITAADAAVNAGGHSIFLWDGVKRYRLFLKSPVDVKAGEKYVAEGVYAQKLIDEIGDPALGKNGYPLAESCAKVVRTAWTGLSFDAADSHTSVLRALVKRYPARPVFLVTKLQPAEKPEGKKDSEEEDEDLPEVAVPADKQREALIEGPAVQPAPLWEPAGGTARCKVLIGKDGKIAELETGAQLCEAVPWAEFRYQPPVIKGKPAKVKTEVEVRFEPRKT